MEGLKINGFEFLHKISSTNESDVFICHQENAEKEQLNIIKVIKKETFNRSEAKIGLSVSHENVSGLINAFEFENQVYLVMDYFEKGSLQDFIDFNGKISERESLVMFGQIVDGVDFLHSNHIIHRDLKPDNIMMRRDNSIKIIDFGLSVQNQLSASNNKNNENEMNEICGTLEFMSPEMILGERYDDRIDIWSLGIILFILINSRRPFSGNSQREIQRQIVYGQPLFDSANSEEIVRLIEAMLSKKMEDRPSLSEIKKTCKSILHKLDAQQKPKTEEMDKMYKSIFEPAQPLKKDFGNFKKQQKKMISPRRLRVLV